MCLRVMSQMFLETTMNGVYVVISWSDMIMTQYS